MEIPIIVKCSKCGHDIVSFDIKQKYVCHSCIILQFNLSRYKE